MVEEVLHRVGGVMNGTAGGVADLVVFDPAVEWHVTPDALHSQGKHTPFAYDMTGMSLPGRVKATVVNGVLAYQA